MKKGNESVQSTDDLLQTDKFVLYFGLFLIFWARCLLVLKGFIFNIKCPDIYK